MIHIVCPSCRLITQQVGPYCQHCGKPLQSVQGLVQSQQANTAQSHIQQPYFNREQIYRDERTRIAARDHPKIKLLFILLGVILLGAVINSIDKRGKNNSPASTALGQSGAAFNIGQEVRLDFGKPEQYRFPISLSAHYVLYKARQANDTEGELALNYAHQTEPVSHNRKVRILSHTIDSHGHDMYEVRILDGGQVIWVEDFWLK
jgi:hypothetical protein